MADYDKRKDTVRRSSLHCDAASTKFSLQHDPCPIRAWILRNLPVLKCTRLT